MLWGMQRRPRVIRRWKAGSPKGDGTYDLAPWLAYQCATAGTTAQIGTRNVKAGFAADAVRAFSRDGVSWGWLVEGPTTNLQPTDDLSAWDTAGSPTINQVALPTGGLGFNEVEDNDASANYVYDNNALGVTPAQHVLSAWTWLVSTTSGTAQVKVRETGNTDFAKIEWSSPDAGWTFRSASWDGATSVGDAEAHVLLGNAGATGTVRAALIQVESGLSPSSYILGSRAAGIVSLPDPGLLFPGGYYDVEMVLAPTFASTEHSGFTLVFWDSALGANDAITVSASNQLTMTHNGSLRIAAPGLSWSRDQELYIRAAVRPSGSYLKLAGFTAGNGEASAPGTTGVVPLPATAYLLGNASGPTQGRNFAVRDLIFREPL